MTQPELKPQTSSNPADRQTVEGADLRRIVGEEEKVLARVHRTLETRRPNQRGRLIDYDAELINLRDQIHEARLEDIPPLIEEMERLQQVAKRRAQVSEGVVDRQSPYFGRLVLEEDDRKREVLIGRSTYIDGKTGIRIVDWRDAPISRIYYRYEEGDDYDEIFGDRDVEGEVLVRRNLSISSGKLRRVGSPQGTFRRGRDGMWRQVGESGTKLSGGQGAAMRPEAHHRPGQLGIGDDDGREDKHLSEITALIDPVQFDLITKPTSGLVVIQGGAGSGKTTIGLHRLAFLAFQDSRRFSPDAMLVIVFNDALVRYISRVLPALGVEDVQVATYERWAQRLRHRHVRHMPRNYAEDTPPHVTRFKKHPAVLKMIETYSDEITAKVESTITETAKQLEGGATVIRMWRATEGSATLERLKVLQAWLNDPKSDAKGISLSTRHSIDREAKRLGQRCEDIVTAWADMLTDRGRIERTFREAVSETFTERELSWVFSWCSRQCTRVLTYYEESIEAESEGRPRADWGLEGEGEYDEPVTLDCEDDALLLRLHQKLSGPLRGRSGVLNYEHVFVDEAQDMSPVELAVVLDTASEQQSVTLAGDVAQKLYMENGFTDWRHVLQQLHLDHVEVEPLKISYRSTYEILEFATDVLGPLRNEVSGSATRHGAPVEFFRFGDSGEAVGFLAEALRSLVSSEPLSSVAIIARYPEQADLYYKGLQNGEVPNLRRIAEQDFPFRPGVDVTDVRQVKGLEFDYVIIVECNSSTFPDDDESRHLLHIGATRAAHQLWVCSTGTSSLLVPETLRKTAT